MIGERPYVGLFGLASLAAIVWLAISYNAATANDNGLLYDLGTGVQYAGILVIAFAFFLVVQGLLAPNPTSVQQEAVVGKGDPVQGILRITRHPFLWGVVIWSAFHIAANGTPSSIVFFGTFLVLAFFGTFSIDAKRKRKLGSAWEPFAAKTSNIPFAAAVSGRTMLNLGESFRWRFWIALVIFLIVLMAHARLFHASPFPSGWVPF